MNPEIVIAPLAVVGAVAGQWRAAKLGYPAISERWSTRRSGTVDEVGTRE